MAYVKAGLPPTQAQPTRNWSDQQKRIFDWFAKREGQLQERNLVVRARAGTGKTTTIVEAIGRAPERRVLLAAFNKRIATELSNRLTHTGAEAKTLHGLGFAFIRRQWEKIAVDDAGVRAGNLTSEVLTDSAPDEIHRLVSRLHTLGRELRPLAKSHEEIAELAIGFDAMPDLARESEGWTLERAAKLALDAMKLGTERDPNGLIDFADMIYLPIVNSWARPWYELVVIDEAQDMSAAQLMLAQMSCKPGGRIAVVGDDRQAIYGFRGADSESLDRLKRELKAMELPLTVTYRCGSNIVAEAQRLVPDFYAATNNGRGTVEACGTQALYDEARPGDAVLSRKNAPLAKICLGFLRRGIPAKIEGKDVGKSLLALARRWKVRGIPEFLGRLQSWALRETERAKKLPEGKRENRIEFVKDQAETLTALCDGLTGPAELYKRIEVLFSDDGSHNKVVCSSIHKAKGLEWDRVFVLQATLYPGMRFPSGDENPDWRGNRVEEENLEYVAITRAKDCLVWVEGEV